MSKYIKADALFSWYEGQRTKYPIKKDTPQFGTMMMYEIFDEISDAPSIDVVFCKDCIFLKEVGGFANCMGYLGCSKYDHQVDLEDFCAWGERA